MACAAAVSCVLPSGALADGDPASDVLAIQSVFVPPDAPVTPRQQLEIDGLVDEAAHHGVQLRVAVIARSDDLGSITFLWRQPQRYASFLADELSLSFRGVLLVVMPNGYGTIFVGPARDAPRAVALGAPGPRLGPAAITAVERIARSAGVALAPTAAISAALPRRPSDPLPWIVFGLGWVAIAAAWTASLRARPLPGLARRA